MISAGQFPTTVSWPSQNFECTDPIISLQIDDPALSDAYWIGWLSYDKLPDLWKMSRNKIEDGVFKMEQVTRAENLDVGLVSGYDITVRFFNEPYIITFKNDVWADISTRAAYQGRLLNSVDINTILGRQPYLQFALAIDGVTEASCLMRLSLDQIKTGIFSETFGASDCARLSGSSIPLDLSFTIDQSMVDGALHTIQGAHTIKLCCAAIGISGYARPINTTGGVGAYYNPVPVILSHADDTGTPYLIGGSRAFEALGGWSTGGIRVNTDNGNVLWLSSNNYADHDDGGYLAFGGYSGEIEVAAITAMGGHSYDMITADGCNFCIHGTGRSIAIMRRMYAWDEVYKFFAMQMRLGDSDQACVYANSAAQYYPRISPENEFLCEIIDGETGFDDLRPWQIAGTRIDADTNDYKPGDKPIYIPPEGDDVDKIGDSIGFDLNVPGGTASGLYTMYALRQAHISNLGAALWTSFNDPDSNFWQNVRMAVGLYEEAGSFDLSTILDYISSIRIYPFALVDLPGFSGAGTGAIRMGTGKIPLDLSTGGAGNVGIMGSYTGIIDAGSVTIPAHYGDFRDLEGVTMSVYLPYIGNVTLNPAEVTGQTLQTTYCVDLTSGSCVAYLLLSGSWGYYPIGVYSGTIGADIPLTASQGNRMFLRDLKNVLGLGSVLGGSLSGVDVTDGDALAGAIGSSLASGATYMAKNIYQQGMGAALTPPTLGGGGANFAGFGAPQTAYVQIRRHLYAYTARNFPAAEMGRRAYGVKVLGTLSGFTVCDAVDVSGIPAPADIQTDIKNMLESGVYL